MEEGTDPEEHSSKESPYRGWEHSIAGFCSVTSLAVTGSPGL